MSDPLAASATHFLLQRGEWWIKRLYIEYKLQLTLIRISAISGRFKETSTLVLSLQLFPPFYQSHNLISNSDWLIIFVVAVEMSSVITSVWQQCIEYRSIIWQLYVLYRITNSMSLLLKHWPHFEPITGTLPWLFVFSGGDRTTISRLVSRSSRATWHAVSGLSPVIMVSCLV